MAAVKLKKGPKILLVLIFLVAAGFLVKNAVDFYKKTVYPIKYDAYVEEYAKQYGVDPYLVYAVIKTESSFRADAVSPDDARGLMQVTPDTFDWLCTKMNDGGEYELQDLFDPGTAIKFGTFFLSYLLDEFGSSKTAAAAYHAGRGITNEWLKNPEVSPDGYTLENIPYADTSHYVNKVMRNYQNYKEIYSRD